MAMTVAGKLPTSVYRTDEDVFLSGYLHICVKHLVEAVVVLCVCSIAVSVSGLCGLPGFRRISC